MYVFFGCWCLFFASLSRWLHCCDNVEVSALGRPIYDCDCVYFPVLPRYSWTALTVSFGSFACWKLKPLWIQSFQIVLHDGLMHDGCIFNQFCENPKTSGWNRLHHLFQMAVDTHCCISLHINYNLNWNFHISLSLPKKWLCYSHLAKETISN